ncbi:MAG: ParB/RepB/Spo0J family partition protein [Candidatus Paceibacterota bacterium]
MEHKKLYRYTSNKEGVFSAGKRLLPESLGDEALEARKWMPKPQLPEGDYRFFLTEKGKNQYERTLFKVHQKYLSNFECEEIDPQKIGNVVYEDEWQVVIKKEIPKTIKEVGFDFSWDEKKVWQLDIPVTEMDITELIWHFDIPFLWEGGGIYNLTPQDVIDDKERHISEYERTMKADLVHPIDIMENKGRWLILDGLHRLMKASILGMKKVKVRIIPRDKIPEITI